MSKTSKTIEKGEAGRDERSNRGIKAKWVRILDAHPEYYSRGQTAKLLQVTRRTLIDRYDAKLQPIKIEGLYLYERVKVDTQVKTLALRDRGVSRALVFRGPDIDRLRRICYMFLRYQGDVATADLLRLAKKIAR